MAETVYGETMDVISGAMGKIGNRRFISLDLNNVGSEHRHFASRNGFRIQFSKGQHYLVKV